jgi:hypothetical protein
MTEISSQFAPKICDTLFAKYGWSPREIYVDLLDGKTHQAGCLCASCLYQFNKLKKKYSKGKEIRVDKNTFFLYWLAYHISENIEQPKLLNYNKDRRHFWEPILALYFEITKDKRFDSNPGECYRIISRLDKTANISKIELAKETAATLAPVYISPLFEEIRRIFEIIKKHNNKLNFPHPSSLPSQTYKIVYVMINSIKKVTALLIKKKKPLTIREISRGCHIKHSGLLMILDYVEQLKIIIRDKANEKISLTSDWSFWYSRYFHWINFIPISLENLKGISTIENARRAFLESTDKTMRVYRESKRLYRTKKIEKN